MSVFRKLTSVAAAALIAAAGVAPPSVAVAASGGAFSVSGKGGPFIKRVADRKFEAGSGAQGMGLADAVSQGQFQSARLHMPRTEAKVAALLSRIEANWPYAKTQPVRVYIVGIDYYSAYALPDGSIMVGFGLLDQAQSDDEVAFVLSHELGHIRLGHFARSESSGKRRAGLAALGALYMAGSAYQGGGMGGLAMAAANPAQIAAGRRAQATSDFLGFLTNAMVEPSWSRNQEDEADALGFDLSEMAPYAAESASARVFDTIQADTENRKATNAALEAQLKKELGSAAVDTARSAAGGGGLSGLGKGLLMGAGRVAITMAASGDGGPKHRPPEARKKGIADYSAEAYPEGLPLREEQVAWLKDVRGTAEYADARIAVQSVRAAMKLRASGDYAGAEREIAKASATTFGGAPMVINEQAHIRDDMGDVATADALFRRAHQSPDQTLDGYEDHARMLYRATQSEPALAIIREGVARFNNDEKPFLALLVAVNRQAGHKDEASRYFKICMAQNDADLKKDCQQMAAT
jgi:Zn-dependent protease with chaperone function